jgi:large subunit ribosomal protein L6
MSRIGNNPISIPEGVSVEIQPTLFTVKGKLGELSQSYDTVTLQKK